MPNLSQQLLTSLSASSLPTPSSAWLQTLLTSRTPPPPLPSLTATARTRLLASDLTTPQLLDPSYVDSHSLPAGISDATVRQATLQHDICVQVLDIENLSKSRWSQVEELEALERGEGTRGREVVRLRDGDGDGDGDGEQQGGERGTTQALTQTQGVGAGAAGASRAVAAGAGSDGKATHKLVLQDAKGKKVYGLELKKVAKIGVGKTSIGEKMVIKAGTSVSRGVIMLEPEKSLVLGGKVDAWHKAWVEGRLARLRNTTTAAE